MKHRYPK